MTNGSALTSEAVLRWLPALGMLVMVGAGWSNLGGRIDRLDDHIKNVEEHIVNTDSRLQALRDLTDSRTERIQELQSRIGVQGERIDALNQKMQDGLKQMDEVSKQIMGELGDIKDRFVAIRETNRREHEDIMRMPPNPVPPPPVLPRR